MKLHACVNEVLACIIDYSHTIVHLIPYNVKSSNLFVFKNFKNGQAFSKMFFYYINTIMMFRKISLSLISCYTELVLHTSHL